MDFGEKTAQKIRDLADDIENWGKQQGKNAEKMKSRINENLEDLKKARDEVDEKFIKFRNENADIFKKLEDSIRAAGTEIERLGRNFGDLFR